jgi:two-component system response regulator MprA
MPKLDGLEMIRSLRSAGVDTPIILTTSIDERALKSVSKARFDCYVGKPYSLQVLIALARRFIAQEAEKKIGSKEALVA